MTIPLGIPSLLASIAAGALCCSCATPPFDSRALLRQQSGESVVFIGDQPAVLAYPPLRDQPLRARSTYLPMPSAVQYVEGRDFVFDYTAGALRRTAESRMPDFRTNILFGKEQMIALIRNQTGAEVILYSAFPPNPKWNFGSHHMADYATATEGVAREMACAYADVFDNWQSLAARKKPEDLLGNNINHPNDFGHWIYAQVFSALGL
jgi:hypothetical protein